MRAHDPPAPSLFGYDPVRDLPPDHLARLVEIVVEEALPRKCQTVEPGQPALSVPHAGRHAKRRTLEVAKDKEILEAARQRFGAPEHVERYHHRAEAVETVFGFVRSALGLRRWSLRGKERVACEARLFTLAYQVRKVHAHSRARMRRATRWSSACKGWMAA